MVALRVAGFAGMVPRRFARALEPNQAQIATNVRVTNGQLGPIRNPKLIASPDMTGIRSIFRMVGSDGAEKWLSWTSEVDVARGPIASDTAQRIYWTGDGEPRMSTYADATAGGGPYPASGTQFVLGAFPPQSAPTTSPSGGSGTAISTSVVYTFLTALGEESQPSPASATFTMNPVGATLQVNGMETAPANSFTATGAGWSGGTATFTGISSTRGLRVGEQVAVSGFTPAGYNGTHTITALTGTSVSVAIASNPGAYSAGGDIDRIGLHNYNGGLACKRIYVSITGVSGDAEYRLWADNVAIGNTSHSATFNSVDVARGALLPSLEWAMPPAAGRHLSVMANGIGVMAAGKDIYLSEPFRLHAWPTAYMQPLPYNVVGTGWVGNTVVLPTEGEPYVISGVDPSTMGGGAEGLKVAWPCLSKRGIVSTEVGVFYPTRAGLVMIAPNGSDLITREFYTEEEWRDVYPSTFIAAQRDNRYYGAYTNADAQGRVLILDKAEYASVTMAVFAPSAMWTDPLSGKLYLVVSDKIYEWDAPDSDRALFDWMSREFLFAPPLNFAAAKVDADFDMSAADVAAAQAAYDAAVAANAALLTAGNLGGAADTVAVDWHDADGDALSPVPSAVYDALTFELICDGVVRFATTVTDDRPFRLPKGYKSDNATIRIAGNVRVSGVILGQSMKDLRTA